MKYIHFASIISKKGQVKEKHYFENNYIYIYKINRIKFVEKFYIPLSIIILITIYLVSFRIQSMIYTSFTSKFINNVNPHITNAKAFATQSLILTVMFLFFYSIFTLVRNHIFTKKIEQSNEIIKINLSDYKVYIFEKMKKVIDDNTLSVVDNTTNLFLNQNEDYRLVNFFKNVEFEKLGYKRSIYSKYMSFVFSVVFIILPIMVSVVTTDNDLKFHYQARFSLNILPIFYVGWIILIKEGNLSFPTRKSKKILQKEIFKEIIRKKENEK